jgi:predicted DNA-binding transcriptional regulator AlpA
MDIDLDTQKPDTASAAGLRLITRPRLRELLQISPRVFQQLETSSLPAPILINTKRCWLEEDIRAWLESRRHGARA